MAEPDLSRENSEAVTELEALIEVAGKRGYTWHMFRMDRNGPDVLAGVHRWRDCADVLVLLDDATTHAYRVPLDSIDLFSPRHVVWWYGCISMVWTLRRC